MEQQQHNSENHANKDVNLPSWQQRVAKANRALAAGQLSYALNTDQMNQQQQDYDMMIVLDDEAPRENESDIYSFYSAVDRLSDEPSLQSSSSSNSYDTAPDDMSDCYSPAQSPPWEGEQRTDEDDQRNNQEEFSSVDDYDGDGSETYCAYKTRMYGNNDRASIVDTPSTEQEEEFDMASNDYRIQSAPSELNFSPSDTRDEETDRSVIDTSATEQDQSDYVVDDGDCNEESSSLVDFQLNGSMYEIGRSFNDTSTEQRSDVAESDFKEDGEEDEFQTTEVQERVKKSASPGIEFIMNRSRPHTISQTSIYALFSPAPRGASRRTRPNSWHCQTATRSPSNSTRSIRKRADDQSTGINATIATENSNNTEYSMSDELDRKLKLHRLSLPSDTKQMQIWQEILGEELDFNRNDNTDITENNQASLEQNNNTEDSDLSPKGDDDPMDSSPEVCSNSYSNKVEYPTDKSEDNLEENEIKDLLKIENCRLDEQSSSDLLLYERPSSEESSSLKGIYGKISPGEIAIHPTVISPDSNENHMDNSNELLPQNSDESEAKLPPDSGQDANFTKTKLEYDVPNARCRSATGLVEQMIKVFSCKQAKDPETEYLTAAGTTIYDGVKSAIDSDKLCKVDQPQQRPQQPSQSNFVSTVKLEKRRRCETSPHTEKGVDCQQADHHHEPHEIENMYILRQHVSWLNKVLGSSVTKLNQSGCTVTPVSPTCSSRRTTPDPINCCYHNSSSKPMDNQQADNSITPSATNVGGSGSFPLPPTSYNNSVELRNNSDAVLHVLAEKHDGDNQIIRRQNNKRYCISDYVSPRNTMEVYRTSVAETDKPTSSKNKMKTSDQCERYLEEKLDSQKNRTEIYVNGGNTAELACSTGNKLEPTDKHADRFYVKNPSGPRKNSTEIYVNGGNIVEIPCSPGNKLEPTDKHADRFYVKNPSGSRKNSTGIYVNGGNIVEIPCSPGNKLEPTDKHADRFHVKSLAGSRKNSTEIYVKGPAIAKHNLDDSGSNTANSRNNGEASIYTRHFVIADKPYLESRGVERVNYCKQDGENKDSFVVSRNNDAALGIHHARSSTGSEAGNTTKRDREHSDHYDIVLRRRNGSKAVYLSAAGDASNSENGTDRLNRNQDIVEEHGNTGRMAVTQNSSMRRHYGDPASHLENKAGEYIRSRPILLETQNTISSSNQRHHDSQTKYQTADDVQLRPIKTSVVTLVNKNLQNRDKRASELPPNHHQRDENVETPYTCATVLKPMQIITCKTIYNLPDGAQQPANLAAETPHVRQSYCQGPSSSQAAEVALKENEAVKRRHTISVANNHQQVQYQNRYLIKTKRTSVIVRTLDVRQDQEETRRTLLDVGLCGNWRSVSGEQQQGPVDVATFRCPVDTKHRAVTVKVLPVPASLHH